MPQPLKIIGFTATCFRIENCYDREGYMVTMLKILNRTRHKSQSSCFWSKIIYYISHEKLLKEGYLSPIEYIHQPLVPYSEIPVNKSHSDYNLEAYSEAIIGREAEILSTITEAQKRYKSVLVFCSTVEQAERLSETIKGSVVVTGNTKKPERKEMIEKFKQGIIQTVFNVSVLTTGFDMPSLDCIVLLRPTRSPNLYNQILGRLTRTAEGKTHGTVIDLSDTCRTLGRIETFKMYRNERGLWDLKTEKCGSWSGKVLFKMKI